MILDDDCPEDLGIVSRDPECTERAAVCLPQVTFTMESLQCQVEILPQTLLYTVMPYIKWI